MRCSLALLLLAAGAVAVQASSGRALLQGSATCPISNCKDANSCIYNSNSRRWSCKACVAPLVPTSNRTACTCVAGKYHTSNGDCTDCPKNFYCPGNGAGKVVCGNGLITAKRGAVTKNSCVNPPGYKYVKTATTVKAVACGDNEYSLGLKQQPTCNPCPPGFVTDPDNNAGSHTSAAVCHE